MTKSFDEYLAGLKREGYSVKLDANVVGASGASHHVDLWAEPKVGSRGKPVVGLREHGRNPVEEILRVFVIALDMGARSCYITAGSADEKLVKEYGVVVVKPGRSTAPN